MENSSSKFAKGCIEAINLGKCKCDCCGCIIIPLVTWNKHQGNIQTQPEGVKYCTEDDGTEIVFPTTEDFKCPFLDKTAYRCMIYDDRPQVCRDFGTNKENILLQCPHVKLNGNLKNEVQKKIHYRQADKLIKLRTEKMEKVIENKRS